MFTGKNLPELAAELERQSKVKQDYKAPTTMMELSVRQNPKADRLTDIGNSILQFRVGDKFQGDLTELMHDQLSRWAGVPANYYDRMRRGSQSDAAMAAANVNHWLRNTKKETRLVRTLDSRARAFLSNRYRTIDNWDVANAALPILIEEGKKLGAVDVVSTDVTENKLYIKVISKRLTYEVKKGDAVQAGIVISNSEVGKGSVRIEPFLFRLTCLNGAVIEDSAVRKFHLGRVSAELEVAEAVFRDETREADDKAFVMKLQDVIRASFDDANFERLKGITIDSTTRKIESPIQDVVAEVANRFGLSESHKDSFLKNLIEGSDISQWGLANAVTAIANKADSYETATRLETIGGELMTLDNKQWKELAAA